MANSLASLVDNLAEGIREIKCKYGLNNKKYETCGMKYKDCECFLEYKNLKNDIIVYVAISIIKKSLMKFIPTNKYIQIF